MGAPHSVKCSGNPTIDVRLTHKLTDFLCLEDAVTVLSATSDRDR